MTHLYLIRHADYLYDLVDGQYPMCNQGLTTEGIIQAGKLRDRLATGEIAADVLISSTERGARETADIVAPALDLPIQLDEDVEEWRSEDGSLSTEDFMSVWNTLSDQERPYHRWVEGCETLVEFSVRVYTALNRILKTHQGKTIVIITHGIFIQTSFSYFFGYNMAIPQRAVADIRRTSITHWHEIRENKWLLERSNDCHHLDNLSEK